MNKKEQDGNDNGEQDWIGLLWLSQYEYNKVFEGGSKYRFKWDL